MEVYLLFCALPFFLSPISAITPEVLRLGRDSWLTDEDFMTIIKLSYPYSICCNIYLSDSIGDVETLFNQFRKIYPYQYLLRSKTYDCQGYFLLGPVDDEIVRAMKRVPSSISTTEILIIVDGYLDKNSSIFDTSLYGNANANIVSLSGIWSLTENYLKPRVFNKLNRYDEMVHEYNVMNFQGRELQVSSFYRPPLSYLSRTVNKTIDGVETEVYLADNDLRICLDLERDGIEMKIFMLIAEKLNFTWTIRKPVGPYRYGRRINKTDWVGGVVDMIRKNKVDMAFGSIWVTEDHNMFVNLTEPWYELFIHFLVPRPRPTTSFWALTRPFTVEAWSVLVLMLLVKSLYVYIRAWIDPKFPKRFRNYVITITELTGRLLGTSIPKSVKNIRFQMLLWHTAGWLLTAAYSSSLAARLASSEYEDRIDTVPQFLEANLTWGRKGPLPPFHDYFDLTDPHSAQLPGRYVHLPDDDAVHEYIRRGNYAIFGKMIDSTFFPEDNITNEELQGYRLMRQIVGQFYAAFAVQPWLLRPINKLMLWLKESGITLLHLRDVIRRRASLSYHEVLIENTRNDESARVLGLMPLGAGFSLLLVGLLISTLIFYLELKYAAKSSSVRDVLRHIEKKRGAMSAAASGEVEANAFKHHDTG